MFGLGIRRQLVGFLIYPQQVQSQPIVEGGEHGVHGVQQRVEQVPHFAEQVERLTFNQGVTCSAPQGDLHFVVQWAVKPGLAPNITSSTQVVIVAKQGQQHMTESGENIAEAGEHGAHGAQQGEQFVAGVECLTFIQSVTCSAPPRRLAFCGSMDRESGSRS